MLKYLKCLMNRLRFILISILFFSVEVSAQVDEIQCERSTFPIPRAGEILTVKFDIVSVDPRTRGGLLTQSIKRAQSAPYSCSSSNPALTCQKQISLLRSTRPEEQTEIYSGESFHIQRRQGDDLYIYPEHPQRGLGRSYMRLVCHRVQNGRHGHQYFSKLPCFDADISLLFENQSLKNCL